MASIGTLTKTTLSKSGSAKLTGDVTLTEGSNVTLTQSGQDITIAASGGAGPSATNVLAVTASQVNVSSIGDTYTDTSGNTYAETTNQTRLTMTSYTRAHGMFLSGHVSAGTGSFQQYNFTDSASLNVSTTTSTTEAVIGTQSSTANTNQGDALTIRVKNSGAGGTVTIDAGGMLSCDNVANSGMSSTTTAAASIVGGGGWYDTVSVALLKVSTGATSTIQLKTGMPSGFTTLTGTNVGSSFGTAQANTVFSVVPTVKIITGSSNFFYVVSAISGTYAIGFSYGITCDNV